MARQISNYKHPFKDKGVFVFFIYFKKFLCGCSSVWVVFPEKGAIKDLTVWGQILKTFNPYDKENIVVKIC